MLKNQEPLAVIVIEKHSASIGSDVEKGRGYALIAMLSNSGYYGSICREWFCCFLWEDGRVGRRNSPQGHL